MGNEIISGLEQLFFSFFATIAVSILWNVSRYVLVYCGLTGAVGWILYWILMEFHVSMALSALAGSIMVAVLSTHFSRRCRMPVTVFNIPGIVPLVPGGLAFEAMRNLATGEYNQFLSVGVDTVMVAGAIALGLILAEVLNHNIRSFMNRARSMKKIRLRR